MQVLAFLVATLFAANISAATLVGRVVSIHDGDTVTVLDASREQHKIRLAGIDAPELKQAFGTRSKQNLSALVYNRQVTVEWNKHDRYNLLSALREDNFVHCERADYRQCGT